VRNRDLSPKVFPEIRMRKFHAVIQNSILLKTNF
jgi:hypothetical protein